MSILIWVTAAACIANLFVWLAIADRNCLLPPWLEWIVEFVGDVADTSIPNWIQFPSSERWRCNEPTPPWSTLPTRCARHKFHIGNHHSSPDAEGVVAW